MDDGKTLTFWSLNGSGSEKPNLAWVRTAAQAAVALQLHGVLETTGLPSASARLQHASLPSFKNSRNSTWGDDDGERVTRNDSEDSPEDNVEESFEEGVMHVKDELESSLDPFAEDDDDGNGYDLLPLPVPAPERQILTVGEPKTLDSKKEARFRYGTPPTQEGLVVSSSDEEKRVFLGDMAIDEDIDKLRDVVGHVDNTLSRCLASGGGIERARNERELLHLSILRGLDSWEGLRGKFVSQRALLKGVSGIEQSREVFEESDLALIDGKLRKKVDCCKDLTKGRSLATECFCFQIFLGKQHWRTQLSLLPKKFDPQFVQLELQETPKLQPRVLLKLLKQPVIRGNLQALMKHEQPKRGRRSHKVTPFMLLWWSTKRRLSNGEQLWPWLMM